MNVSRTFLGGAVVAAATLILAACGGGGGGSVASLPAAITGQLTSVQANTSFAGSQVVFSCGCTGQAGLATADANGLFTVPLSSVAIPASPSPTYTTLPGRNYVIVGANTAGAQAWTMGYLGNTPSTNINLAGTNAINTADLYATATTLLVFFQSQSFVGDQTFDRWNFNSLVTFTNALRASNGANPAEKQLLADIGSAQAANQSMFPVKPAWDPKPTETPNATIAADLTNVANSGDTSIPTPCPSICTNAPSP